MQFTRESIFVSSIRAFFKTFFAMLGIFAFVILLAIFFAFASKSKSLELPPKAKPVVSFDAYGNREILSDSAPVILRVNIHGFLADGGKIAAKLNDSRTGVLKDRIKGIFLHINTPGGTDFASDEIYRALIGYKEQFKIPIYASVDGLCASGGMYIASAADKILASPVSIIGSVGVRAGPIFNFYDLMGKVGVKSLTITEGADKDTLNPFKEWEKDEEAPLKPLIVDAYNRFVDIVTKGRPRLDRNKLVNDYGAKVFYASKAQELGFIDDSNGSYSKTLIELAEAAGIQKNEKYQVVELKTPIKILANMFEENTLFSGKVKHSVEYPGSELAKYSNQLLYLYQPE